MTVDYTLIINTNICVMLLLILATDKDLSRSLVHVYNILNIHTYVVMSELGATLYFDF